MTDDRIKLRPETMLLLADACAAVAAALRTAADSAEATVLTPEDSAIASATPPLADAPKPTGQNRNLADVLGAYKKWKAPKPFKPEKNVAAGPASPANGNSKPPKPRSTPKAPSASKAPAPTKSPKKPKMPQVKVDLPQDYGEPTKITSIKT